MGTLLGDLAASDVGPLVAEMLDGESLWNLAKAGVQGRALANRAGFLRARWPEEGTLDLTRGVRVDAAGRTAARDIHTLELSLAGVWQHLPMADLVLPRTVRTCYLTDAVIVSWACLQKLAAALPPAADVSISTSCLALPSTEECGNPIRVKHLTCDWLHDKLADTVLVADALRTISGRHDMHATRPGDMLPYRLLEVLDISHCKGVREDVNGLASWLEHCCSLTELHTLRIRHMTACRLPDIPRNRRLQRLTLETRPSAGYDFTNQAAFFGSLTGLLTLEMSCCTLPGIPTLESLNVLGGYVNPAFATSVYPRLRQLCLTDRRTSWDRSGVQGTGAVVLPVAPILQSIVLSPGVLYIPQFAYDGLAGRATDHPRLEHVLVGERPVRGGETGWLEWKARGWSVEYTLWGMHWAARITRTIPRPSGG